MVDEDTYEATRIYAKFRGKFDNMNPSDVTEKDRNNYEMYQKAKEFHLKKVEENNFGIRKRLLEYDDVMNKQRNVVYKKRNHALFGERLGDRLLLILAYMDGEPIAGALNFMGSAALYANGQHIAAAVRAADRTRLVGRARAPALGARHKVRRADRDVRTPALLPRCRPES